MNNKSFFIASLLIGTHILILRLLPKYIFPEIAFSSSMISITKQYVSEDHFLHPWLLYYIVSYLSRIIGMGMAFYVLNAVVVIIIDSILFYYLKKKLSPQLAVVGLIFYIPWQIYFRGNSLWFDFLTIPFVLLSYVYFSEFVEKQTLKKLLLASSFLSFGYLFKQTILWIALLYLFWLLFLLIKTKTAFFKSFIVFIGPLLVVVILNSALFLTKGIIIFTSQWSFFIPLFIYPRLPATFLLVDKYYFKILIFLILVLLVNLFVLIKYSKQHRKESLFLTSISIMSLANIFPRWSDFRVQPFLVFLTICFVFTLSKIKNFSKVGKYSFIVFLICLSIFIVVILLLKSKNEWRRGYSSNEAKYAYIYGESSALFRNKTVFVWDSPQYQGDPEIGTVSNISQIISLTITNPDKYYRTESSLYSLDQVQRMKPDFIIVPTNIETRLNNTNITLVKLEKYIIENYSYNSKIGSGYFVYSKILNVQAN